MGTMGHLSGPGDLQEALFLGVLVSSAGFDTLTFP